MNISGMNKLTLLDYPGHLACIIFTQGCNFKCPFCHNSALIGFQKAESNVKEEELLAYLEKRKGVLDGIVISGGEPLLQPKLKSLMRKIKTLGFKVKLDTNGTNCYLLKELLEEKLIDYVAMDIKAAPNAYPQLTGCASENFERIKQTVDLLKGSAIDFEFRTTIMKEYHDITGLESICQLLGGNVKYYLQNFVNSEGVIAQDLHGFTEVELKELQSNLNKKFPNVKVRGL